MKILISCLPVFLFIFIACDKRTPYEEMLQRELDSGVRQDSLFLGYYFGMPKQEFFDHSWDMNQQKIITGRSHVRYKLEDFSSEATMVFYPDFKDDKIHRMPVEIQFDAWAIWNRELYADSLIVEVMDLFEDTYGTGFLHTLHPEVGKESWIKIDGNRRISIYQHDDRKVRVEFLDLTAE